MSTLLELAARVESADAADRTLAKDIFRAAHPERVPEVTPEGQYGWKEDRAGWWWLTGEDARTPPKRIDPPAWLTSLDAAMTLAGDDTVAILLEALAAASRFFVRFNDGGGHIKDALPRFLTAACLRARAAQEPSNG